MPLFKLHAMIDASRIAREDDRKGPIMTLLDTFHGARKKWARLQELTTHNGDCDFSPTAPDDDHSANQAHLRDAFIDYDDGTLVIEADEYTPLAQGPEVLELVRYFFALTGSRTWGPYRDNLSRMALDMSLCPMHLVDYAICFDDEDNECAAIRAMFPSHDT